MVRSTSIQRLALLGGGPEARASKGSCLGVELRRPNAAVGLSGFPKPPAGWPHLAEFQADSETKSYVDSLKRTDLSTLHLKHLNYFTLEKLSCEAVSVRRSLSLSVDALFRASSGQGGRPLCEQNWKLQHVGTGLWVCKSCAKLKEARCHCHVMSGSPSL